MKISINEPCHENWDNMKPNDKGAFCLSCQKNVVDFTAKSVEQIKDFFNELPQSNNVCGRFKEKQLNEMSFEHFFTEFLNWKFIKRAAVIFYLSLGAVLFSSCADGEYDKVGKMIITPDTTNTAKQISDTLEKQMMVLGEPAIVQGQAKVQTKCEADSNNTKIDKPKNVRMGGPMVQRDTAEINKKARLTAKKLVNELNPKDNSPKEEKINEIAPGKSK